MEYDMAPDTTQERMNSISQSLREDKCFQENHDGNSDDKTSKMGNSLEKHVKFSDREVILVGLIDKYLFTRQCVSSALSIENNNIHIFPYSSCHNLLKSAINHDVFIFIWHDENINFERSELASEDFKTMTLLGPIIVLGATEQSENISRAFRKGICGFIPIRSASTKLIIDGIHFAKSGIKFGIPFHDNQVDSEFFEIKENQELTRREKAVLKLLMQGKPNKVIAHELSLSESTIKGYVYSMMKKMKVSNRTGIVCQIYTKGS